MARRGALDENTHSFSPLRPQCPHWGLDPAAPHPLGTAKSHLWGQLSAFVWGNWGPAPCPQHWHRGTQLLDYWGSPHGGWCCASFSGGGGWCVSPVPPFPPSPGHLHAALLLLPFPQQVPRRRPHHLGILAGPELLVCSGSGTGPFPSSPVLCPCWDFCFPPQHGREPAGAWLGTSSPRRASIILGAQKPPCQGTGDTWGCLACISRVPCSGISAQDSLKPKSHFIGTIHDS